MSKYSPYTLTGKDRPGPWLITVDHARNHVPDFVNGGDLGLPASDMGRHIAYDIGAEGVSKHLGQLLNSPVLASNFSRLVIDPNRGEDDPTLIMQLYDGSIIPANAGLPDGEREQRLNHCYRPYHDAYVQVLEGQPERAILAIHSFTPRLNGRAQRPWEVGILFAHDQRLTDPLIDLLQAQGDICVGVNEPYAGHLPGDSVDRHALRTGRLNALIEIRNDLIDTEVGQKEWAARLAPLFQQALEQVTS